MPAIEVEIEIQTTDPKLLADLFDVDSPVPGATRAVLGGVTIELSDRRIFRWPVSPETIQLLISFSSGVASGLVANWLFQKLCGRARRLRISRIEVEISKDSIKKVFEEFETK